MDTFLLRLYFYRQGLVLRLMPSLSIHRIGKDPRHPDLYSGIDTGPDRNARDNPKGYGSTITEFSGIFPGIRIGSCRNRHGFVPL